MRKDANEINLLRVVSSLSVAFGVFYRLDDPGREGLWLDEIYTARRLTTPTLTGMLVELQGSPFPPLYYIVLRAWVGIWGTGNAALRGLATTLGLLAIPTTYYVWNGLIGRRASLWAVALLATNAFHIWYSRDAKMYTAVWLLSTIACGAFLNAIRCGRGRLRWLVILGLSDGCLPLISYVSIVPLGIQAATGIYLYARRRELRGILTDMVAATAIAMVPAMLWLSEAIPSGTGRTGLGWITRTSASRILPEILDYASIILLGIRSSDGIGANPGRSWSLLSLAIPYVMMVAAAALAASLKGDPTTNRKALGGADADTMCVPPCLALPRWLAIWALMPIIGSLAFSTLFYPLWGVPRYLSGAAPAILLWAAVTLDRSSRSRLALAAGLTVIGINVSLAAFSRSHRANPPWAEAARTIAGYAAMVPRGALDSGPDTFGTLFVLLEPYEPLDALCLDFELSRTNISGVRPAITLISPLEAIGKDGPFLVVKNGWNVDPSSLGRPDPEDLPADSVFVRRLFEGVIHVDPYKMIPNPNFRRVFVIWECIRRAAGGREMEHASSRVRTEPLTGGARREDAR